MSFLVSGPIGKLTVTEKGGSVKKRSRNDESMPNALSSLPYQTY